MPKNAPVQSYGALKLAYFEVGKYGKLWYRWIQHQKGDQKRRETYV